MRGAVVGIDLGGTNVKTGVVDESGELLGQDSRPSAAEGGPDAVMGAMVESMQGALKSAGLGLWDAAAVGIGAPGPMNWQTGVVYSPPNLPGWKDVPLAELMTARLNGTPVFVDNDANVACYGEFWMGSGRDVESMCLLTLGTGVGGGIVLFNKLLRGPDGTAAEIGHLNVMRGGRQCNCGAKGCLEQYASASGLVKTALEGIAAGKKTKLLDMCGGDVNAITGKMISEAIGQGDAYALEVMQETGRWLGVGVGSLINLLNPEMVVFSGGMIAAGDVLFDAIRDMARQQSFEVPFKRAKIVPASLGTDAGIIGAAGCAIDRLENRM